MIVPDFWAEAKRQHRDGRHQITVKRFGWSTSSSEDAAAMAEQRVDEAIRRLVAGEALEPRERKAAYNGAEGVPIREEVLARHGDDVITRNAYGARCLNSPNALFADVDFQDGDRERGVVWTFVVLAIVSVLAGIGSGSWKVALLLGLVSVVAYAGVAELAYRLLVWAQGGPEARARSRLARFLESRPDWGVRVYKTPAGLRLLATHRPFAANEPEVVEFFDAISADPRYVRMCLNQQCFRARLTAKPWRIGISDHLRPRPGVWPVAPEYLRGRAAWVAVYEARSREFASCRFVDALGSRVVHRRLAAVVDLHDRESRALDPAVEIA